MWHLSNRTPYAAERTWVRDKNGHHVWVVAVKATFDLADDGKCLPSAEQEPPLREPVYLGEPGHSSLCYDAELVPPKPLTDVVINAHAHAPGGRPVSSVEVAVCIDDVQKRLVVYGERFYRRGVLGFGLSSPEPFTSQPIVYEWALGGTDISDPDPRRHVIDLRNPVGRGLASDSAYLWGKPAHRIEYPQGRQAERGPAGFGPLASHWSPRLELQGTFDESWSKTRRPLLPIDHDERSALCSPVDQRPSRRLEGGERIELFRLTPQGWLGFVLPCLRFRFETHFGSLRRIHEATLGTAVIEPELKKLRLVYQTGLHVGSRETDHLDFTVITMMRD